MKKVFSQSDIGCYADGALGQSHIREKLIDLLSSIEFDGDTEAHSLRVIDDLRQDPSDDFGEENEAIDLIQEATEDGLAWIIDGDLLLMSETEV